MIRIGACIAYATAWVATAAAVSFGIYVTHSPSCLWAMLLPACISMRTNSKDEDKGEGEGE